MMFWFTRRLHPCFISQRPFCDTAGVQKVPLSACSGGRCVVLMVCAQSGLLVRLNMATPHVLMASETQRMPSTFMTRPVFT